MKESKNSMLSHKYEMFKIKSFEFIFDICSRFINIINDLNLLKKKYNNTYLVRKILRSLLRSWKIKVIIIQEQKNQNQLSLKEHFNSLMTYEHAIIN